MLLRKQASKRCFIFPPRLTSASAYTWQNRQRKKQQCSVWVKRCHFCVSVFCQVVQKH